VNPLGLFLRTSIPFNYGVFYSECLPTRLNPLAERACFSQVRRRSSSRRDYRKRMRRILK
jgi:hypothetical protein